MLSDLHSYHPQAGGYLRHSAGALTDQDDTRAALVKPGMSQPFGPSVAFHGLYIIVACLYFTAAQVLRCFESACVSISLYDGLPPLRILNGSSVFRRRIAAEGSALHKAIAKAPS